jgi:hypothetical protein
MPCHVGLPRERIDGIGASELVAGFLGATKGDEVLSIANVSPRQVGVEFQSTAEFTLRARPVPVEVELDVSQRCMSFGKRIVEFERLGSGRFCFRHYLEWSLQNRALIVKPFASRAAARP